ncbi:transcriptional regulator, MarR family with acetyltransferase activity [Geosporobacter subterraneus DSM 17957]|uniref:Transcriptional regulator, MarR family with acetyltransferase activity n=1 Tax=Geosporobacter subterraneus DSM 17957 TaxID=1121919 RepID=A0A1M6K5I3_9FIRM|nr:bifunctional helix-turn-helix transcriptional regulator/GNAT family N-acetyltransferase [Geosporobacter subterraneus]SHJ54228.1 transcriptional regulator, MarR family with acetyltransferase activity [Geosporobacter subterraneus DSM 17957]
MHSKYASLIHIVRRFNRFYTNVLGLLDQHMLDSEFSLAEARILYDIGHTENCTAKELIEELRIDSGYLSRIIKRFVKDDLIYRKQSTEDGRLYYLYLTDKGKDTLSKLDDLSNGQIYQMISCLSEQDKINVVESMKSIENTLKGEPALIDESVKIRCDLRPGDVGILIHLHGWIYAEECGYNHAFEGYVCKTFYNLFENYSPEKDRFWFAEMNGKMIGAIAIIGHSEIQAQLRWFIIHPAFRRIGLGRKLMNEAMNYCKEKGYQHVFLETTEDQKTAIRMYIQAGFCKVAERESSLWGKNLVEQTYELYLA